MGLSEQCSSLNCLSFIEPAQQLMQYEMDEENLWSRFLRSSVGFLSSSSSDKEKPLAEEQKKAAQGRKNCTDRRSISVCQRVRRGSSERALDTHKAVCVCVWTT